MVAILLAELDGQRQADVAQADDGDGCSRRWTRAMPMHTPWRNRRRIRAASPWRRLSGQGTPIRVRSPPMSVAAGCARQCASCGTRPCTPLRALTAMRRRGRRRREAAQCHGRGVSLLYSASSTLLSPSCACNVVLGQKFGVATLSAPEKLLAAGHDVALLQDGAAGHATVDQRGAPVPANMLAVNFTD